MSGAWGIDQPSFTAGGLTFTGNPNLNGYISGSNTPSSLFGNQYYVIGNGFVEFTIPGASNIYAVAFSEACSANCNANLNNVVSATSTTTSTTLFSETPYPNWPNLYVNGNGTSSLFFGIVSFSPLTQSGS